MTKFFSWHWDIAGFGASLLCAIQLYADAVGTCARNVCWRPLADEPDHRLDFYRNECGHCQLVFASELFQEASKFASIMDKRDGLPGINCRSKTFCFPFPLAHGSWRGICCLCAFPQLAVSASPPNAANSIPMAVIDRQDSGLNLGTGYLTGFAQPVYTKKDSAQSGRPVANRMANAVVADIRIGL